MSNAIYRQAVLIPLCFLLIIFPSETALEHCSDLVAGEVEWDGQLVIAYNTGVVLIQPDGQSDYLDIYLTDEQYIDPDEVFLSPDKQRLAITAHLPANERQVIVYNIETGQQLNWPIKDRKIDSWYDDQHLFISPEHPLMVGIGKFNIFTGEISLLASELALHYPMDLGWETESGTIYWEDWREQYSPDKTLVFYRSGNNLVLVNRETGDLIWQAPSPVTAFEEQAVWQPNGAGVAYLHDRLLEGVDPEWGVIYDLFYLSADGNNTLIESSVIFTLSWSPDGKYLAFLDEDYSAFLDENYIPLQQVPPATYYCIKIFQIDEEIDPTPVKLHVPDVFWSQLWISGTQIAAQLTFEEIWLIDITSKTYMSIQIPRSELRDVAWRIVGSL